MNWQTWWIGSRTQWNVTKDFYMGVDVLYQKLQTATGPFGGDGGSVGLRVTPPGTPSWVNQVDDVDNFSVRFRVHRDFYP